MPAVTEPLLWEEKEEKYLLGGKEEKEEEEEAEGEGEGAHSVVGRPWWVRQLRGHTMDGGESRRQPKVTKLLLDVKKGYANRQILFRVSLSINIPRECIKYSPEGVFRIISPGCV